MERWRNKIAVVTGASSGVGAACVKDLVIAGVTVAALARREHKLNEMRNSLPEELRDKVYLFKCDVTNENDVVSAFKWIKDNLGSIHILINSAGTADSIYLCGLYCSKQIQKTIDTNVMGTVICAREAFNQMKEEKIDGHIVLLNSAMDHHTPPCPFGSINIYSATKCAITAMAETYRQEFSASGTNVKVTVSFSYFPSKRADSIHFRV